ncbi:hypothetical protein QE152_g33511 [Popillia japonica]|uniref:Uncharacterized protein n=1 Tax=Popillia japonica TaxID=7064 RepID=A0AAW1IWI5_POPJA
MVADAGASLKDTTLEKAWNKLCLKPRDSQENGDTDPDDPQEPQENDDPDEIREIIKEAPGFEECDKANIDDWLNCDVDDPGYQILSVKEIVQQIKDDNQEVGEQEEDGEDTEVEDDVPTHDEAFTCLEKAMKWLEHQAECNTASVLKKTRRFCRKKNVSSSEDGSNNDVFFQDTSDDDFNIDISDDQLYFEPEQYDQVVVSKGKASKIQKGAFVLVKLVSKKLIQHYVANVLEDISNCAYTVKFYETKKIVTTYFLEGKEKTL